MDMPTESTYSVTMEMYILIYNQEMYLSTTSACISGLRKMFSQQSLANYSHTVSEDKNGNIIHLLSISLFSTLVTIFASVLFYFIYTCWFDTINKRSAELLYLKSSSINLWYL